MKYLGNILSNNPADHVESRCKSDRKDFCALQSAELCKNGVDPCTIAHIYNVAIKPLLTYRSAAVGLSDKHVTKLEKLQGSLIKTALGLSKFCRNTSLMRALGNGIVKPTIDMQYLTTLKNSDNLLRQRHSISISSTSTAIAIWIRTAACYPGVLKCATSTILYFYNLCILILMVVFLNPK